MAKGYSPSLPLTVDPIDGFYKLNKTYKEFITQNLKMLLLTIPGERMMDPDFGVGLKRFLFENSPYEDIIIAIETQIAKYMPFLEIQNIAFNEIKNDSAFESNATTLSVKFNIIPLDLVEILEITQFLD